MITLEALLLLIGVVALIGLFILRTAIMILISLAIFPIALIGWVIRKVWHTES